MRHILARLARIEASAGTRRNVIVWEDGTGSAEREIARLRAAGDADDVEFVIVSWLR